MAQHNVEGTEAKNKKSRRLNIEIHITVKYLVKLQTTYPYKENYFNLVARYDKCINVDYDNMGIIVF